MYQHTNSIYHHMQDVHMKGVIVSNLQCSPGNHCGSEMFIKNIPGYTMYSGEKMAPELSPIDLSPFNSDGIRDSDSPLDLSVKTRKRHADSTDEFDCLGQPKVKRSHFLPQPLDLRAKDQCAQKNDCANLKARIGIVGKELTRSHIDTSFRCSSYDPRAYQGRTPIFNNNPQNEPENNNKFHPAKDKKQIQHGVDQKEEFFQMIRGMTKAGSSLSNGNQTILNNNAYLAGLRHGSISRPQLANQTPYASKASMSSSFFDMGNTTCVLRCSPDSTTMKQSKYVRANIHDNCINGYCPVKPNSHEQYRKDLDFNSLNEWFTDRPIGSMQHHSISSPAIGSFQCQSSQNERTYSNPDNQLPGGIIHYKTLQQVCRDEIAHKHGTISATKLPSREHNFINTFAQTVIGKSSSSHAFANFVSLYNIQPTNTCPPHRSITKGTSGLVQQPAKYNCRTEARPKPTAQSDLHTSSKCNMQSSSQSATRHAFKEITPSKCDNPTPRIEKMNYETPLSISIPSAQLDGKPQTNELIKRHPKLAFKKHIIISSARKYEDHQTITPSQGTKICDANRALNAGSAMSITQIHGSLSPNPSSPKMPTLSPQFKLPPPLISPLTVEPPTLDRLETDDVDVSKGNVLLQNQSIVNPVATILPGMKNKNHSDDPDTNSSTVFSNDCCFQAETPDQKDISRITKNSCQSVFSKDKTKCSFIAKQSGCSRNIPVANVAPMVHKKLESPERNPSEDVCIKTDDKISNMCDDDRNCVRTSVIHGGQSVCPQPYPIDSCDRCREIEIKAEKSEMLSNVNDSPVKLSPLMKKILRQRQLSKEHSVSRRSVGDEKTDLGFCSVLGCNGDSHTDHLTSFEESDHSSCETIMKSRNHRRCSLIDEIANSNGFVDESKRMKTPTNDLLSDPSLLSREDRALRRAIILFEKMENKSNKPKKSRRKTRIITNTKRKADQLRKKARLREDKKKIESRKRMMKKRLKHRRERQKGFVDFKPRILKSRTRMQAAGKRGLAKYDRNAAYDKELTREETRNEHRKRVRLEQHRTRSSTRSRSRSISVSAVPETKEDKPPVHEGSWQIQGVSHTSKQTLRSGRSKGGLMLKLSWRPNQNKFSRRVACRRKANRNINIRKDCLRYATLNCPYKKRGGESYSFVRNAGHYLRQNIRKLKARNKARDKAKKVDANQDKGTKSDYPIVTRSHVQRVKKIGDIPKVRKAKKTKRRFRRCVKIEVIEKFQKSINQEISVPVIKPWTSPDEVPTNITTSFKQDFKKIPIDKKTGETLLHRAARLGYQDLVIKRFESGDNEVNVRDNAGFTPLHESCAHGHLNVARQLIHYGADVNMASLEGIRPIHDAVENNYIEVVRLLLSHGADPNISYAGKTVVKMAKTDVTKRFLQGHIADLNGLTEEESPWEFYGSSILTDPAGIFGCDLFEDAPSDPEDDSEGIFDDTHLSPIFRTFDLVLEGSVLAEECILLSDILQYLQVSKVYFDRKISGCDLVHCITKEKLLISMPEDLCSLSYISIDESVIQVLRKVNLHNILSMFRNHANKICRRSDKQKSCSRKKKDMVEAKDCDSFQDNQSFQFQSKQPGQTDFDYPRKKDSTTLDILNKWNDLSESQGSLDFTLMEGTVPEDCFSSIFLKNQIDQNEQGKLPCENFPPSPDNKIEESSPVIYTNWS